METHDNSESPNSARGTGIHREHSIFFRDNNSQNICIIRIEETQVSLFFENLRILNVRVNE